jgi:hypothetical protein
VTIQFEKTRQINVRQNNFALTQNFSPSTHIKKIVIIMGQVISFCIPFCSESEEDEEPYQFLKSPEEEIAAEEIKILGFWDFLEASKLENTY